MFKKLEERLQAISPVPPEPAGEPITQDDVMDKKRFWELHEALGEVDWRDPEARGKALSDWESACKVIGFQTRQMLIMWMEQVGLTHDICQDARRMVRKVESTFPVDDKEFDSSVLGLMKREAIRLMVKRVDLRGVEPLTSSMP